MAKLSLKAGTTSQTLYVFLQDSASTTGAGKTGLAFNTAGLTCYYVRPRAAAVAVTLATQTVTGAWAAGGFVEVDATNCPGLYRFDPPDAALASGAGQVNFFLKGTGVAPCPLEVELTAIDNQNATTGGLGNLDAAVSTRSAPGTAQTITANQSVNVAQWLGVAPNALQAGRVDAYLGAGAAGVITATLAPNLDAAVSSRSTYAGTDTAGTTTLLARLTAGRATNLDNLDAAVSTRSTLAAAGVWDLVTTGHTTAGTFGAAMNAAGSAGDPWATLLPGAYGAGTAGNILGNRLDAAVSTRSTYAGADTAGTTTLLTRLPGALTVTAGKVDVNDRTGFALASTGLNLVLVDGKTLPAAVQYVAAAACGKVSGAGGGVESFTGIDGATARLSITVDASGNRTAVSYL